MIGIEIIIKSVKIQVIHLVNEKYNFLFSCKPSTLEVCEWVGSRAVRDFRASVALVVLAGK